MNTETTPIDGEVLDSMPVSQNHAQTTALAVTDNPYMVMAMKAMEMGKVDQLDKLLDLHMKWDAEQARKAFVAAMADFKAEAGGITIAKSKHVSFTTQKGKTEYNHAELHDITRALVPLMAKHGISHRWVPAQEGAKITVTCVMTHRSGHSESVSLTASNDDSGGKNSIQSIASAKTYLERYTLLAATGIATGGELEDDGRSYGKPAVEYITDAQLAKLQDMMDAFAKNKEKFMNWVRYTVQNDALQSLSEVPSDKYDAVYAGLIDLRELRTKGTGDAA